MRQIRKTAGVLFLIFALLLPGFQVQAAVIGTIRIAMTKPEVGKELPTDAHITNNANIEVTDVKWSGKTKDGKVKSDTKYTAVITVEVKPDKDDRFTSGKISTMVNNKAGNIKVNRESDTVVKVTYTVSCEADTSSNNNNKLTNTAGKNASDVKALEKIIKEQNAKGAKLSTNLDSGYTWKNGRLDKIHWNDCGLTGSLSLKAFPNLTVVYVDGNELTKLDVSGNSKLRNLSCHKNKLTELDVSKNKKLERLWCSKNKLTKLDLSNNPEMWWLHCEDNKLTKLDVSKVTELLYLECRDNKLTKVDVSKNKKLEKLDCRSNPLTKLDLSKNKKLLTLICEETPLTKLDLSKNTKLNLLYCKNNKKLTKLDLSKNKKLLWLYCKGTPLTELDLSKNPELEILECPGLPLTRLDVRRNPNLVILDCSNCKLTKLDLSRNTQLQKLYCSDNQLTELEVRNCTELTKLFCYGNQLTELHLSLYVKTADIRYDKESVFVFWY